MDDLENLSIKEFVATLNESRGLSLNEREEQAAVHLLHLEWFSKASELAILDATSLQYLNLPLGVGEAILDVFRAARPDSPASPVAVGSEDEVDEAEAADADSSDGEDMGDSEPEILHGGVTVVGDLDDEELEEDAGRAASGSFSRSMSGDLRNRSATLGGTIKQLMENAGDNAVALKGVANVLRRGIMESDRGTMKASALQGYLKEVQSKATLNEEEMAEAMKMAYREQQEREAEEAAMAEEASSASFSLECGHVVHKTALHDYVMNLVGRQQAVGMTCPQCDEELNTKHIQACLSEPEFNQYLEATLMAFIEQDNLTFTCPSESCDAIIAMEPMPPQEVPNPMLEKDAEGRPLTAEAWLHFQEYRIRCRVCNTVFCAECKRMPYHKGFTCKGFADYQVARRCRFCGTSMTAENTAKDPPGPGLRDVCTDEECLHKRDICCWRVRPCGCNCNGVRDEPEEECLPCLEHEQGDVGDEFCSICYVEALNESPCVQLSCGHTFHYECVQNKLKAKWPGARISFEFMGCPLCNEIITHNTLATDLAPLLELKKQVESMAVDRLKHEGRMKEPDIVNDGGRFHDNPLGFAMHAYVFHECFKCKRAYFAGGYQCQEANAAFDAEELICPSCQPHSVEDCPVHGRDWLAHKCRFCCNYSTWYCWGNAHFCDSCHKSGVWQKLVEFRSGKNKKRIWDYPQCAGLKPLIQVVRSDRSLSDEARTEKLMELRADPATCPIGVPHPPNGFEFGLGCSMCEDKDTEAANRRAAEKAKREAAERERVLQRVKQMIAESPNGLELVYEHDMDKNGLFWFLGTSGRSGDWRNPADAGFVSVSASGTMGDSVPLSALCGRDLVRCVTKPTRNAWMMVDLQNVSLMPTQYTIRHYSSWDTECLRNWVLEGSNDGIMWDVLLIHKNDKSLNAKGATATWDVDANGRRYRMFRILQTGFNSNQHLYLATAGIEFYGRLFDGVGAGDADAERFAEHALQPRLLRKFNYTYDFDKNGMFFWLGTDMGRAAWQNPARIDQVIIRSSPLAERPASTPADAIVGRQVVRCVTVARPNTWFQVDLKDKKAIVTHYTLRHYNSWDTEALRHWRFEGSNDGRRWITLKEHKNDAALNKKGAAHTWAIDNPHQHGPLSMFRIYQTGKNSNSHYYLACSGMEFYGELFELPPVKIGDRGLVLTHQYDFDCNGLMYWIGTRGLKHKWRNPADAGFVRVSCSQLATNPPSEPASYFVGRELVRCVTAAAPNMWFAVDLKSYCIQPTAYTLKHYSSWDTEAVRNWVFEASNDGRHWVVIREHINDASLDRKGATKTWRVNSPNQTFRILRCRMTGPNSNNHNYLSCSGFEVFGRVYDLAGAGAGAGAGAIAAPPVAGALPAAADPAVVAPAGGAIVPAFKDGLRFTHVSDFDENGIVYFLGTCGRTRPFYNPGASGVVRVSSSQLASQSKPAYYAIGREVVRCVTESKKYTHFAFDFGKVFIVPTHYTLRHYSSWDTEALRNWKLEGSVDGKKWKTLRSHKKDKSLDRKGAAHTWEIKGVRKSYSMFRITQTGKNSNRHWYLSLSGFEIYGAIYSYRYKG